LDREAKREIGTPPVRPKPLNQRKAIAARSVFILQPLRRNLGGCKAYKKNVEGNWWLKMWRTAQERPGRKTGFTIVKGRK